MKAAVLARGRGSRMREADAAASTMLSPEQRAAADAGLKAMMPIRGEAGTDRPFLDYVLAALFDGGVTDLALIVEPGPGAVRDYYTGPGRPRRAALTLVEQTEPLGTAHSVLACERWTAGAPFLVMNADNLYPSPAIRSLVALDGPGLPVFERDELVRSSGIPSERVASFALLEVDDADRLIRIEEKPEVGRMDRAGPRALVSMNCWRFDARIFTACREVRPSPRGEFELPMAVALAMDRGVSFQAVRACGPVLDLSRRQDITAVERRLAAKVPCV